jgi:formylglycine-generating enzyme required for sulfatase activity
MDKYEVTNLEYQKFVLANPQWQKDRIAVEFHDGDYLERWNGNDYPSGKENYPVVNVSWYAAMAYAQ